MQAPQGDLDPAGGGVERAVHSVNVHEMPAPVHRNRDARRRQPAGEGTARWSDSAARCCDVAAFRRFLIRHTRTNDIDIELRPCTDRLSESMRTFATPAALREAALAEPDALGPGFIGRSAPSITTGSASTFCFILKVGPYVIDTSGIAEQR